MNNDDGVNWGRLGDVYRLAIEKGVSFSLHYEESDGSFWVGVYSMAPGERWSGGGRDFDMAIDDGLEWLRSL